jgi:hypothetical protein
MTDQRELSTMQQLLSNKERLLLFVQQTLFNTQQGSNLMQQLLNTKQQTCYRLTPGLDMTQRLLDREGPINRIKTMSANRVNGNVAYLFKNPG